MCKDALKLAGEFQGRFFLQFHPYLGKISNFDS